MSWEGLVARQEAALVASDFIKQFFGIIGRELGLVLGTSLNSFLALLEGNGLLKQFVVSLEWLGLIKQVGIIRQVAGHIRQVAGHIRQVVGHIRNVWSP